MAKHAKHEDHEEHADESWLVPYADVLTLLLALFIVLFATASDGGATQAQLQAIAEAFYIAFNGDDIPNISGKGGDGDSGGVGPGEFDFDALLLAQGNGEKPDDGQGEAPEVGEGASPEEQAAALAGELKNYINENGLGDLLSVRSEGRNVYVTLSNDAWFKSGSPQVQPEMVPLAEHLRDMVLEFRYDEDPWDVVVTGHTDNVPQHTADIPDNWTLSVLRATNFLRAMGIGDSRDLSTLDPAHFTARGMGELDPIAENDTIEGRRTNRRVELSITKNSWANPAITPNELPTEDSGDGGGDGWDDGWEE